MATVTYCDKCESQYQVEPVIVSFQKETDYKIDKDLCINCRKSLRDFFNRANKVMPAPRSKETV